MSFASTALRHRERESKALRIFLACSLAGSLIFHLALLASGIGKYLLNRVPEVEDEPVEITLLDTPIEEIEPEPKEEVKPKPKPEPKKIEPKLEKPEPKPEPKPEIKQPDLDTAPSQSRISGGSPALSNSRPNIAQSRVTQAPPVIKQPLPKPEIKQPDFKAFNEPISPVLPSAPPVKVREKPVIPEQKPEPKPEPIVKNDILKPIPQTEPEPEVRTPREFSTPVEPPKPTQDSSQDLKDLLAQQRDSRRTAREFSTPVTPTQEPTTTQQDSGELRNTLSGIRESRDTNISSNNTAPSPDTSNIGESNSNASRRRRRSFSGNVAAAPTNTTDNGTGNGSGDSIGDGDGNAACVRCNRSYPAWARNRGIQGSITVSVNADAQGNVTDVELISGSGNDRLDKHHLRMARRWKLKSSSDGRKGVTIVTRYELQ
ncbi:MAG: TonB family protein [Rivularia sp. (in: cyanobacteria)]|jgi:TonB family protein